MEHNPGINSNDQLKHMQQNLNIEAEDAIQEIINLLEKQGYVVKQNANQLNSLVKKYTKNNPFKTIGISILAGVVLGWLWRF